MRKMEKEGSYSHILHYTGLFGGVQGLNILIGIVRNKFAAMFLGPSGMGLVSLFNSTISLLVASSNLGLPTSGVQAISVNFSANRDRQENTDNHTLLTDSVCLIRSLTLIAAVMGMLLCALLCPWLDSFTFGWGNHTLHFLLLSPVVAFSTLLGGELAVLKATRQLRSIAFASLVGVMASLLISAPIYYIWGEKGIVPVLFLLAFTQWLIAVHHSCRYYPLRYSLSWHFLRRGCPVVKLGLAFVAAAMLNSGAEFLIRTYLNNRGDLETVGLFNAACTLVLVYAGMVFSAMESDYFPRLSSMVEQGASFNACVNKQMEINLLLMGPILAFIILILPIAIPILYNSQFSAMTPMAQIAAVSMLFKAVYLPIEYIPLSRGDSRVFMGQEAMATCLLMGCEMGGYHFWGLSGMGAGITLAYCLEALGVMSFAYVHYGYVPSRHAVGYGLFHLLLVALVLVVALSMQAWSVKLFVGGIILFIGILASVWSLRKILQGRDCKTTHQMPSKCNNSVKRI